MIQMSKNKNWLDYYGSSVNSEWMIPKILEVKHEAPEILRRARYIMEAGDYITSILTNSNIRSNCGIGFKGFGTMKLDLITTSSIAWILIYLKSSKKKCEAPIISIGESAGRLCKDYQQIWGFLKMSRFHLLS